MFFKFNKIDTLIRQLGEHSFEQRQIAMIELAALATIDNRVVNRLLEIITSEEPTVPHDYLRSHAVKILGLLKFRGAIDLLNKGTSDESSMMRAASAVALGRIGDEDSIPILKKLLSDDIAPWVREGAAHAIVGYRRDDVYQALIEALADENIDVSENASDALISMREDARPYAKAGLEHSNEAVRKECKFILHTLDENNFDTSRVWVGLNDESLCMRLMTVTKLWLLCIVDYIHGLKIALDNSNRHIRLAAVLALGCINTDEAHRVLVIAKKDKDKTIRKIVQKFIGDDK